MKTIVFIDSNKSGSSREAIKASEELGYYNVLLTNRQSFIDRRTEFPDVHLMQFVDLDDMNAVRETIRNLTQKALRICAIISFTDKYCYQACLLADEFGVNKFTKSAVGSMTDKILTRSILSKSRYATNFLSLNQNDKFGLKRKIKKILPAVVKSPLSSGSKDVFKVNSLEEVDHYRKKLIKKYPSTPVLVEEYLDGPQYLVEVLVFNDEIHIIAVIQQEITFSKRFIITGYNLILSPEGKFYDDLKTAVEVIIKMHGMKCGACHLEIRHTSNGWKLIEINPRISGAGMNKMIEIAYNINLVKETLKLALGEEPDLEKKQNNHVFTQYVVVNDSGVLEKVTGKNEALRQSGVQYVYVKPKKGSFLTEPVSMGNRYAYVIATGESEEIAKKAAKTAASMIDFHLVPKDEDTGC